MVDPLGGKYGLEGKKWHCNTKCSPKNICIKKEEDGKFHLVGRHDKCGRDYGAEDVQAIPDDIQVGMNLMLATKPRPNKKAKI